MKPTKTFVTQYQEEIKSVYGIPNAGAGMTHTHKGIPADEVTFKRNPSSEIDKAFRKYWTALSKKTEYTMAFDEDNLIKESVERINQITIPDFIIEASSFLINTITEEGKNEHISRFRKYNSKNNFYTFRFN